MCIFLHADCLFTAYLLNQVGVLTDALTGLERILTTPVPFS
jgi:predicted membrane chloride channel (bestrophin family)